MRLFPILIASFLLILSSWASFLHGEPAKPLSDQADPLADEAAQSGGTLNSWAGPFPKALNMWLDYNGFSSDLSSLLFVPLITLHSTKNEPVGILAHRWTLSEDQKTFTFHLRPEARWSDGEPITAEDVQFYYDVMMNPKNMTSIFRVGLSRFDRPKVIDRHTVEIQAHQDHWMNLWEAGGLVAFPKHRWAEVNFNQQKFRFPAVSGPYEVEKLRKNRFVLLKQVPDWWGRQLSYFQHKYNFSRLRFRFINDRKKALESFKKGDLDVYPIYTASIWIKETDFPQVQRNWVVKQRVYNQQPKGFQGLAVNLRREPFQDIRVRKALALLLNRQLMNEKLMHREYFMLNSHYPDLYPGNVNPAVPITPYDPSRARALLAEAGWKVNRRGKLEKEGKPLQITFMTASPDHRHLGIYVEDLKKVGIEAKIEQLSQATIRKRLDQHDFDLYWMAWGAGRLRDPEAMWHSSTAHQAASNNIAGVEDSEVDRIIEAQKQESHLDRRNELLKQLDQRLLQLKPYLFLWQLDNHRLLYWNQFGRPEAPLGKYGDPSAIFVYWWEDGPQKKRLKEAQKAKQSLPQEPTVLRYREMPKE